MKTKYPGYLALFFLVVFTVMSFLYTAPERYTGDTARRVSASFMVPWFKQNWMLFGPDVPTVNYAIHVTTPQGKRIELFDYFNDRFGILHNKTRVGLYNWCVYLENELMYYPGSDYYRSLHETLMAKMLTSMGETSHGTRVEVLKDNNLIYFTVLE